MLSSALLPPFQALILFPCIFDLNKKQTKFIPFVKTNKRPSVGFYLSVHTYTANSRTYIYEALAHQKARHRTGREMS